MDKHTKKICQDLDKKFNSKIFKNTTILITGANGLIGGLISEYFNYLNSQNYNITLLLTSKSSLKKAYRLQHIINQDNTIYVSADMSKWQENLFSSYKIDYCFYCSGYAQPSKFLKESYQTLSINTTGLYSLLKSIYSNNPNSRTIYLSSSEVYSNNLTTSPHKEKDEIKINLENKRNFYILGKLLGENIINDFKNNGFYASSARISLCYGPGVSETDERVMSELVRKGINNTEIQLFDEGSATRRYLYITDCCNMIFNIITKGIEPVYNVGGTEETTIYEMAKYIGNIFNKKVKKGKNNNNVSNSAPKKVWISQDLYNKEFGNFSLVSFKKGLQNFVDWYIEKLKIK